MPNWGSGGVAKSKAYVDKYGGPCTATRLMSRNVSIEYNVRVINETKGVTIACGSTVTKGDKLSFEFVPHHYTDISWNGVGYSNDTPYGDWIANAGPPAGSPHQCLAKDQVNGKMYVPLSVAPPSKSITGQSNLGCSSLSDGVMKCTPTEIGSNTVVFNFGATSGQFYGRTVVTNNEVAGSTDDCLGSNSPMRTYTVSGNDCRDDISSQRQFKSCQFAKPTANVYTLPVPVRTISCPITVVDAVGNPPAAPNVTASGGACVAGTPYTISMNATDPDGDKIRYAIDWNNNGTIDEYVPASGFVNSGTAVTASRSFGTAGAKTVKVLTQDESGLTSTWASVNFTCSGGTETVGLNEDDDGVPGGGNGGAVGPAPIDLTLRAIPSLVRQNNSTKVNWSATGVVSCTVTGTNSDSWNGLTSPVGGETSRPITGETKYTLSCRDARGDTHSRQVTVRILPTFQEK